MCHKSIEICLPSVTKGRPPSWETVWPSDKSIGLRISQNWGLIPPMPSLAVTLALTLNLCSSLPSVTGIMLAPAPARCTCGLSDRARGNCPVQCRAHGRDAVHTDSFPFLSISALPITCRLKPGVLTTQWTGPSWQEGTEMVQLALKRWLNCPTMEIHIINLSHKCFICF